MLRTIFTALCANLCLCVFAQDISGIVNKYYKVTAVNKTTNSITVTNTTDLHALDKVMLVQMKGATINTDNSSSFGTITNIKYAGNYELATICSIKGNDVYFINTISRDYDVTGKVQLVKIPTYNTATVTAPLEAAPWDNTTGTGGVLAISVSGTLTLNANISADGMGFKGGQFILSGGDCIDNIAQRYFYNPNLTDYKIFFQTFKQIQLGASKGETIADIDIDHQGGMGAAATGGGGGNNHNTGGGGGANVGNGGNGGNNTSTGSNCSSSYAGLGGKALNGVSRIFLGGGGGSGHGNNTVTVQTGGGNGGGIIYIDATTIKTNGFSISANGQNGSSSTGDGASAGGAGGTIIIKGSFADAANIAAKGGNGGRVDNENISGRCFGDGGGGGGGGVYITTIAPAGTNVSGGLKGGKINSSSCTGQGTSSDGGAGSIVSNYTISQSLTPSSSCIENSSLPVNLIYFKAFLQNKNAMLEWQVTDPQDADHYTIQRKATAEDWKEITTINADATKDHYTVTDATISEGAFMYRLQIVEKNGNIIYSPIRYISFNNQSTRLAIYPNPVTSRQEVTIQYNFKGGDAVKIFDAAGRLVLQKVFKKEESVINLNLSNLQKGMYLVVAANATGRLMIQ